MKDRKYFKPLDLLVVALALVCAVFALLSQFNSFNDELRCIIRVEGEQVFAKSLGELDSSLSYDVEGDIPLTVIIESDGVYVKASNCPDKLCEHTGKIKSSGQSIVCLPAKATVTLESSDNELDAVVG